MSPEDAKQKALETIDLIRQAKACLSRAMDQCADLPGWATVHRNVIRNYDTLGILLGTVLAMPPAKSLTDS